MIIETMPESTVVTFIAWTVVVVVAGIGWISAALYVALTLWSWVLDLRTRRLRRISRELTSRRTVTYATHLSARGGRP